MKERELLATIESIVETTRSPLLAREIVDELKRHGIDVERSTVNSALYRGSQHMLVKDVGHRWGMMEPAVMQVVTTARATLKPKEIALELKRRGYKTNTSRMNHFLYLGKHSRLTKDKDNRWGPTVMPRASQSEERPSNGAPTRASQVPSAVDSAAAVAVAAPPAGSSGDARRRHASMIAWLWTGILSIWRRLWGSQA